MTCPYCHDTGRRWLSGRWPHVKVDCNHQPAETPKEERVREFNVRAYEDHWIVQEEAGGEPKIVEGQQALTEALAWHPVVARPVAPKKPRTRRTKEQIAAAKAAKEAKAAQA